MGAIQKYLAFCFIVIFFLVVFRGWFSSGVLSSGDWPYLYPSSISQIVSFSSWDVLFNNGMGQSSLPKIWFDSYALSLVKIANTLSWPVFERLIWFFPYVLLSFSGAYLLSRKIGLGYYSNLLSGLIYSSNTYIILIVSGGQVGVFTAYAFLPYAFYGLYHLFNNFSIKNSVIFGLLTSIVILLDLRIGYMFLLAVCVFSLFYLLLNSKDLVKKAIYLFIIPGVIAFLLHFYWIFPILLMGRSPVSELSDIYASSDSLSFFSFAKLETAAGLLHPNWPENIFGKISFLRPEFLILPILGFMSLLFIDKESKPLKLSILSFTVLGLVGIFLSKGTNDPFGEVYRAMFDFLPGFVMFRDPTKWYLFIALFFCILIPYCLEKLSKINVTSKTIKNSSFIFFVLFFVFWNFLIKDAYNGVLKGTLVSRNIPENYKTLASDLQKDGKFYRTLWVPQFSTFGYVSGLKPAIPAMDFFSATSQKDLKKKLKHPVTEKILKEASVKYIIIPDDIDGKIFTNGRKYDERVYQKTLKDLEGIEYLSKTNEYGKLVVFELKNPKDHFWSTSANVGIAYESKHPTRYVISLSNVKKGDKLIFTESYDRFWSATRKPNDPSQRAMIPSVVYKSGNQGLNSFVLPDNGSYMLEVYYQPQKWINSGILVSGFALAAIIVFLSFKTWKGFKKS